MLKKLMLIMFAMLLASGCGEGAKQASSEARDSLPAGLITSTSPTSPRDIVQVRKSAKAGEAVTLRGRVGGRKDPLVENRAVMTLVDMSLRTCDKSPMEKCETPWDSCCEPADVVSANSATVQVVGSNGKPLRAGLAGAGGIAPGKEVVVS